MDSYGMFFILISIIFIVVIIYLWLTEDQKRSAQLRTEEAVNAPAELKDEVSKLDNFNPQDSQPFFDHIEELKQRCNRYPQLVAKLERKKRNAHIALLVYEHQSTLLRNLRGAVKKDDYGTIIEDKTTEEIMRFLGSMGYHYDKEESPEDLALVQSATTQLREADEKQGFDPNNAPTDGIEFEHWVSDQLSKYNWDTSVSQPGSDQGIDIIAKYNKITVGIQCKRYTANVGNKAVQEAYAAQRYFGLDKVIVITTAGYTKSAMELAEQNNVGLHTVDDIPMLARLLRLV